MGLHFDPTTPSRLKSKTIKRPKGTFRVRHTSDSTEVFEDFSRPEPTDVLLLYPKYSFSARPVGTNEGIEAAVKLAHAYGQGSNLERCEGWNEDCEDEAVSQEREDRYWMEVDKIVFVETVW